MRNGRRNPQKGMTIVEVAIAAAVLGLVFVSTITAMQVGYNLTDTARSTNMAGQVLQSRMEEIRGLNWADIQAMSSTWSTWTRINTIEEFSSTSDRFEYRQRATEIGSSMRQVEVQVRWTGIDGVPRQRTFINLFAENGVSDYYYTR